MSFTIDMLVEATTTREEAQKLAEHLKKGNSVEARVGALYHQRTAARQNGRANSQANPAWHIYITGSRRTEDAAKKALNRLLDAFRSYKSNGVKPAIAATGIYDSEGISLVYKG